MVSEPRILSVNSTQKSGGITRRLKRTVDETVDRLNGIRDPVRLRTKRKKQDAAVEPPGTNVTPENITDVQEVTEEAVDSADIVYTELGRVTSELVVQNESDPAQSVTIQRIDAIKFEAEDGSTITLLLNNPE